MLRRAGLGLWRVALRAAYRLIYGPLHVLYDAAAFAASGGEWQAWQAATLPHLRGPRVLEVACGPGHLLARIAASGHTAIGVDRSLQMTRRARRWASAPVVRADARALPFRDGACASVVMTFSGLTVNTAILDEVRRVLAPGGRLVVLDEIAVRGKDWRSRLARGVLGATAAGIAWPARERMEAAGFRVTVHAEPVGANAAQVLVGVRAGDPEP